MRCFYSFPLLPLLIPNLPCTRATHSLHKGFYFNHKVGITLSKDRALRSLLLNHLLSWSLSKYSSIWPSRHNRDFILFRGEVNTGLHGQPKCQPKRTTIPWHRWQDCWVAYTKGLQSFSVGGQQFSALR